jgi:hypothetical protein
MKERTRSFRKTTVVRVSSQAAMTPDQQFSFSTAVDALLAELVRSLDRPNNMGADNGRTEEQMAGQTGHRRRTSE